MVCLALASVISLTLCCASARAADKPSPVSFDEHIRPLLEKHCTRCHGSGKQRAGLRLDRRPAAAFDDGIITPGRPDKSTLYLLLVTGDADDRMPQDAPALMPDEAALVSRWIAEGAPWPAHDPDDKATTHWAYQAPVLPTLPALDDPWINNPIDAFVREVMRAKGLRPSSRAEPEVLMRRVSLDLTGLPPSPDEIDAFTQDASPDAWERLVKRLLASPQYGERWARPWLDLARYGDSNGYEKDRLRSMWMFRDWVIESLNANMPFDRFTIEQLAGDMLPNATTAQKIASGFHANTLLNEEGGVDPLEARFEVMVDRTNTTASVWMGSTLGCAQCHNHKYDPFSARDYYRFLAFFDNTETITTGDFAGNGRPMGDPKLLVPNEAQARALQQLSRALQDAQRQLDTDTPAVVSERAAWMQSALGQARAWKTVEEVRGQSAHGARFSLRPDRAVLVSGPSSPTDDYTLRVSSPAKRVTALQIEVLPDASLPEGGPGRAPNGSFMISRLRVFAAPRGRPAERVEVRLARAIDSVANKTSPAEDMLDDDPHTGWSIGAQMGTAQLAAVEFATPLFFDDGVELTVTLEHQSIHPEHTLGCFRLSVSENAEALVFLGMPAEVRTFVQKPAARAADAPAAVAAFHRSVSKVLAPVRERIESLGRSIEALGIPSTLVMKEKAGPAPPSTPFRDKGAFTSPGEPLAAGTPAVLPPMNPALPRNRLGLAQWLASRDNPLIARVTMNRMWETLFGRGLVETAEDFGTQGSPPSHPKLLDWLAVTFMDKGWDAKAMLELIVSSATYQQSARTSPRLQALDPYNVYLARGPRFRVEAEMVRDIALAASGLLSLKRGGPSVFPPQPEGVWEIPYNDAVDSPRWTTASGEDRFRRGVYTFIRRSATYPVLTTFDGNSRQVCTVRRIRTNTPLQALTLLNDQAFLEMARGLSERMAKEAGSHPTARLQHGHRLATGRRASAKTLGILTTWLHNEEKRFARAGAVALLEQTRAGSRSAEDAARVGAPHEQAAWTLVANVLLNMDATQTKE